MAKKEVKTVSVPFFAKDVRVGKLGRGKKDERILPRMIAALEKVQVDDEGTTRSLMAHMILKGSVKLVEFEADESGNPTKPKSETE